MGAMVGPERSAAKGAVMDLQNVANAVATVNFQKNGNLQDFSHEGFSVPEEVGTWSLNEDSWIVVPVSGSYSQLTVHLRVQPCIVSGLNTSQSLTASIGGIQLQTFWARSSDWADISFELPGTIMVPATGLKLAFRHPTAVVPSAAGHSSDTRKLGFMFESLRLEARGSATQKSPPPPSPVLEDAPRQEVQAGVDGWLFLTGGSNDVWRYFFDPEYFTELHAQGWMNLIVSRYERLKAAGVEYFHIAAPDKISVYPDYFGKPLPNLERTPIRLLRSQLTAIGHGDLLVDPSETFATHPDRDRLYLKTDTHWSYLAGQAVLQMVLARLGLPRSLTLAGRTLFYYDLVWDLGSKVVPSITERNFAVTTLPTVKRVYSNELALKFEENMRNGQPVSHGSIYVHFHNTSSQAVSKTLVIFGDSFMDFQDSNTTVIFAENFRDVHFVWSPNIDYQFVDDVKADIVITELAERFMISMPNDDYRVKI